MSEEFKLRRRTESYNLDDVQRWLVAHPSNSITIEYAEGGYAHGERTRPWKINIHGPRTGYAPGGYIAETIHQAVECLFEEDRP